MPAIQAIYQGLTGGSAEGLGIAPQWEQLWAYEEELAEHAFREEIGTDAYVTMLDAPPTDDALVSASLTGRGGPGARISAWEGCAVTACACVMTACL